ncbi:MAG: hypothetical protein IJV65_04055 [Kiritimatiellae bacterium]|nr:hypothetical protein [Kiritimatiellia bacterium]
MNDTNTAPTAVFDAPRGDYNPRLSLYHANGKNTGTALQFELAPATPDRDGALFLAIARQKTVGNLNAQGLDRFASFDWANKTTVKLGFLEVAEILMVFGGQASVLTHAGKEGLFHNSPSATTSITLKRADDPARPGFILGVGRTPKADPNARQYAAFAFWPAEAFALRLALQAQMGLLAFGIPRERRAAQPAPAASFAPPPAAPAPFPAAPAAAPVADACGDAF